MIVVATSIEGIQTCDNGTILYGENIELYVYGMMEFQSWFHHLDLLSNSPLHRKLLYAATDSFESLAYFGLRKSNYFARMKKFTSSVHKIWKIFGWGLFFPKEKIIQASVQTELTVGFALAAMEFFEVERLKFESNQLNDQTMQLSFQPSKKPMKSVSKVDSFDWDIDIEPSIEYDSSFEVDKRPTGWYLDEQRSFFLPRDTMLHFYHALLPLEFHTKHRKNELLEIEGIHDRHIQIFRSVLIASSLAEQESTEPSFVQTEDDWTNILGQIIPNRGFGQYQILQFDIHSRCVSLLIRSTNAPYIIGKIWSKWEKATGSSSKCSIVIEKSGVLFMFSPV